MQLKLDFLLSSSDAFDLNFGVVIMRLRAGFDATEREEENGEEACGTNVATNVSEAWVIMSSDSICARIYIWIVLAQVWTETYSPETLSSFACRLTLALAPWLL